MHGNQMKYMLVGAGALAVGFLVAGTPVRSLLPFVLMLVCPLMIIVMMRGMGGHGGHGHGGHGAGCHDGHGGHDAAGGAHGQDARAQEHKSASGV